MRKKYVRVRLCPCVCVCVCDCGINWKNIQVESGESLNGVTSKLHRDKKENGGAEVSLRFSLVFDGAEY